MPKVNKIGQYAEKDYAFVSIIEGCMKRSRKNAEQIAAKGHFSLGTHYNRLRNLGDMRISELRVYINEANIPEEDVLNALYLKRKEKQQ